MNYQEIRRFFNVCKPSKALDISSDHDRKYYIDFSSVRGGQILEEIERTIDLSDEDTCQIFTGHRGSGKSTELLRLKAELEQKRFHVVYFESDSLLDMTDIDISDILLVIAGHISESMNSIDLSLEPGYFIELFEDIKNLLWTPVDFKTLELSAGIAKVTTQAKESPTLRAQLREVLEARTKVILDSINQDILEKAKKKIYQQNKRGIVVIVDNLEKISTRSHPNRPNQLEYLFVERGSQLRGLQCHMIYTVPLQLVFSAQRETMVDQFGGGIPPRVLPMVPIRKRNGQDFKEGLFLLKQMVMARAFPEEGIDTRFSEEKLAEIFDSPETLERLCRISGGRVRNLLSLIYRCLQIHDPPIQRSILEYTVVERREQHRLSINDDEWSLLRQVAEQRPHNIGQAKYQNLFRNSLIFEYRDRNGNWFDVNPVLLETPEMENGNDKTVSQ